MVILSEAFKMKTLHGIIYMAINNVNGKTYIGQTTRTLSVRKAEHKHTALKSNKQYWLYDAIRKYGFDLFSWSELDSANSKERLDALEQYYIYYYDSFSADGYNMNEGGNGVSDEMKLKNRLAKLGNKVSTETKEKMKQSHLLRYKDLAVRLRQRESIVKRWENDTKNKFKFSKLMSGKGNHQFGKKGSLSANPKQYIIITPENKVLEINCLAEFCRDWKEDKLNPKNMNMVAMGKRNHHHGYKCFHANLKERATTIPTGSTPKWAEAVGIPQG